MKAKIIDFSNGIFTYKQAKLKTEPQELVFELEEGKGVQGSFIVSSCDERRIKGILYSRIPGFKLLNRNFFGRAARIEFTYRPECLRPGEGLEDHILLVTDAGEYELPVKVKIQGPRERRTEPDEELVPLPETPEVKRECRKGRGRSEEWKKRRRQEYLLMQIFVWIEKEKREGCEAEVVSVFRRALDELLELDRESPLYPLLNVWVMLREGRREEAGWALRKYEVTRLFQQRDMKTRAVFVYVNSLYKGKPEAAASGVAQLQKFYMKQPDYWLLTWILLNMDKKLTQNARTRYMMLERQFRAGTRNRLLYQEAWDLLKNDMALFTRLDAFTMQIFAWAASHGLLTGDAALLVAAQSARLKRWSVLGARLLKGCYQVHPSKETAGAVCGIYIRGHRTDGDAFVWYQKGVELDAKITNLYEYFMYALPEDYPQLLPKQVILYFAYHNTLTGRQRTAFYCNLVKYNAIKEPEYEEHRRRLQEFLLKQLKERRLNESLAWLYGRCLLVETLERDMLEALADLLFLQKITCEEKRIRQVEVSYEQLDRTFTVPVSGGNAVVPIYTPQARITLVDEQGKRHRKTVPYKMKRLLIEPRFLQVCETELKRHLGLNLYLFDKKSRNENGKQKLNHESAELACRLLADECISEAFRQKLQLLMLEYERKHGTSDKLDERFRIQDVDRLSREEQAAYIEHFILLRQDEEAYALLKDTGCRETNPRLLLRLLQRLLAEGGTPRENLRSYAEQVFKKGVYTENIIGLLAENCEGSLEELLGLWRAGEQFGLDLPKLEEQIAVQALFTESRLDEAFPVFASMDDRGTDPVVCSAWLNYMGWLDFVKQKEAPEGFFDCLENHLIWEDRLADVAYLSYLKQLSVLLLLSDAQKRLVKRLMKDLGNKCRRFSFMQNLYPYLESVERAGDGTVVEYRCNPEHKVTLHYVLEYHGKKTFDYVTERIFPVYGGVFTRAFILFYGERLTWFFTEEKPDGTSVSTVSKTVENKEEHMPGGNRYQRICLMQRAMDYKQERALKRMMMEYEELTELTEERFRRK